MVMAANHFGEHLLPARPQPHHAGVKRHADDDVETNSNISTHFKRLRINHAPRQHPLLAAHYAPAATPAPAPDTNPQHASHASWHPPTISNEPTPTATPPTLATADFMPVDETSHRIVIHDLDAEIAAIEAEEPTPNTFFLADIDKKVSAIPHSVLQARKDAEPPNTQLVLYRDPVSISVPEGEDAVRKAIVEARKRTRERQAIERREARVDVKTTEAPVQAVPDASRWTNGYNNPHSYAYGMSGSDHAPSHFYTEENDDDPDAMDIC